MPEKSRNALRLAVLVSGAGTTLQYLIDSAGELELEICAVFADRHCAAVERAALAGIPCEVLPRKILGRDVLDATLLDRLVGSACDLLLLAGYLSIVGPRVLASEMGLSGRIWNMHPALLPAYGGVGMYGMRVHRAVFEAGETFSGCTLHRVVAEVDAGAILCQRKIQITDCDTVEQVATRVQHLEKQVLFQYLQDYVEGKL